MLRKLYLLRKFNLLCKLYFDSAKVKVFFIIIVHEVK